jgi:putative DNA primase/helicase
VLHIWHGSGANGKGTLRDAVRHALGEYAVEVPPDILLLQRHGQQALAPERMRLRGARVAFCSEIPNGARLDEATMKRLTGGDPVNAKLLYRNPIEFDPSHTLFMLTNHLPGVRGDDPAVWRRILAVPFNVVVPNEEQDTELPEKLKRDAEAVLAWLWRGWLDYQQRGLDVPETVRAATRKYQEDSDLIARYLAEDTGRVVLGHGRVASAALYDDFKRWVAGEGEDLNLSNKAFSEQLELRGFRKKRASGGQAWQGLMLAPDPDDD